MLTPILSTDKKVEYSISEYIGVTVVKSGIVIEYVMEKGNVGILPEEVDNLIEALQQAKEILEKDCLKYY